MDRHQEFRAGELGEVIGSTQRGDEKDGVVGTLLIDRVGAFGDGQASLLEIGFADGGYRARRRGDNRPGGRS